MVLMGVGEDKTDQILALLFEKTDVGHDEIDTRQMFLVAKGYAEIDRKPGALVAVAESVDRQVHADLTDAAERRKSQFIRVAPSGRPCRRGRAEIDVAGRYRDPPAVSRPDNHAARIVDGVECAFDRGAGRLNRYRLSQPRRPREPEPPDLPKATAIVPKLSKFRPRVR